MRSLFVLRPPRNSSAGCVSGRAERLVVHGDNDSCARRLAPTYLPTSHASLVSLPRFLASSLPRFLASSLQALTEKHQLMKGVKSLLKTEYKWEEAWINGVTAAIMTKRLETSVDKTKAAIDYLVSKGIPIHRVENMVSINKQILARTLDELKETVEHVEGKGITGDELARFLMTNPVILRYGPVDSSVLALRKADGPDARSKARVVTDAAGQKQCVYYREGVVLGQSPISMKLT